MVPQYGYKAGKHSIITLKVMGETNEKRTGIVDPNFAIFRCSKAIVVEIENYKTKRNMKTDRSIHDENFIYEVGNEVVSCMFGIFYYKSKEAAEMDFIRNEDYKEGVHKYWDSNGQLTNIYTYKYGRQDGIEKSYIYGKLIREWMYKNGQMNGLYRSWHLNGCLQEECTYNNWNRDNLYRYWHDNGCLQVECTYNNGVLDGLDRCWDEKGELWLERTFKNGKLDGMYREWHIRGCRIIDCTFKDGMHHETWHRPKSLIKECTYKDGIYDGLYREWDSYGTRIKECLYIDGKLHGSVKKYDSGTVVEEWNYKKGVLDGAYRIWWIVICLFEKNIHLKMGFLMVSVSNMI
ncbi:MAG TPA: DUF5758 domain-containing protein [Saprospiraceae bacterium]|nr:DUF5758 domain-containing protein [Saprospiraceae bacterium]